MKWRVFKYRAAEFVREELTDVLVEVATVESKYSHGPSAQELGDECGAGEFVLLADGVASTYEQRYLAMNIVTDTPRYVEAAEMEVAA